MSEAGSIVNCLRGAAGKRAFRASVVPTLMHSFFKETVTKHLLCNGRSVAISKRAI